MKYTYHYLKVGSLSDSLIHKKQIGINNKKPLLLNS
jgi:hypothetical protein